MAKYFTGISINKEKYAVSILDNSFNIIIMDNLEAGKLIELLKRKSATTISIDAPLALYLKNASMINKDNVTLTFKKRSFDNIISSKKLLTYNDRFTLTYDKFQSYMNLLDSLSNLGFSVKKLGDIEKSIIECYPEISFKALGFGCPKNLSNDDILKKKIEFLKKRGVRIKDYLIRNKVNIHGEIDAICQAYTAYLYSTGEYTSFGNKEEGLLIIPCSEADQNIQTFKSSSDIDKQNTIKSKTFEEKAAEFNLKSSASPIIRKTNSRVVLEYCGAQYLYTNTDGVIRINDLRPIKTYRPFSEIYDVRYIKLVQVVIGTTDGLRKIKASLIPNFEGTNSFKAANEEDKKKLDGFWGICGDKRGYLIKFNMVEVIKA